MNSEDTNKYNDIIDLCHPVSKTHPPMSIANRAAQFAPFAALTGYNEAIDETARLTEQKIELDEDHKAILDGKIQSILEHMSEPLEITVTYFQSDQRKNGGAYCTVTGSVKKIDEFAHTLIMQSGEAISIEDIYEIESDEVML